VTGSPEPGRDLTVHPDPGAAASEQPRPATDAERRAVAVEELALRLQDRDILCCDSSLVTDLLRHGDQGKEGPQLSWSDDVRNLCPDPSTWDVRECRDYIAARGGDPPDGLPDPWSADLDEIAGALRAAGDDPDGMAEAAARDRYAEMIGDGTITGLRDWQEAVRDCAEAEEVYEWWRVSPWLVEKLQEVGEVVIDSDYGGWWGRTTTGQGTIMDGVLQRVAARLIDQ
jgi:hypothetical protein